MSELVLSNELKGVDESKAAQIKATFEPMVKMLEGFESSYSEIMALEQSEEKSKQAKRVRIDIGKIRIETEKNRKAQKEEYLRAGKAIDGVANIVKWAVTEKENALKEVETYYERIEAERIAKIQAERLEELSRFDVDGSTMDLGKMPDDVWSNLLSGSKANYEAKKEAERKAEEKRIAAEKKKELEQNRRYQCSRLVDFIPDFETVQFSELSEKEYKSIIDDAVEKRNAHEKEQEEIRLENERLKKEREEQERKAEAERKKQEEILRKEREAREAVERKAAEEKAAAERKERERLEQERKEKEEQARIEREKRETEEAARKKAEMAPDKEKLLTFAGSLLSGKDSVKSDEAKKALSQAISILTDAANQM